MKKIFMLFVLFICTYGNVLCLDLPVVFSITPENSDFNRCFIYSNNFDSSAVVYFFGDVRMVNGSNITNIPLAHTLWNTPDRWIQADSTQGISTQLESLGRTVDFVIPPGNSVLKFYREISETGTGCQPQVGDWDISDCQELITRVISADDFTIIATIDSVGSNPNTNPEHDARYGTNVTTTHQSWAVPDTLVGKKVFLRVTPKRIGPTKYGLVMKEVRTDINLSTMYDNYGQHHTRAESDSLQDLAWLELIAYTDSVLSVTGSLPEHSQMMPEGYFDDYKARYLSDYDYHLNSSGDTVWTKTTYPPMSRNTTNNGNNTDLGNTNNLMIVYPNPLKDKEQLRIRIESPEDMEGIIRLETLNGDIISKLWDGIIIKGKNNVYIDNPGLSSGTYFLRLLDMSGKPINGAQLRIIR